MQPTRYRVGNSAFWKVRVVLRSIELQNFKAFGVRNRIDFAPITLIFGENSAGKSSILQAINLLKQSRENREYGALLLPRAEGGIVDLGGFQEMVFDHDLTREIAIRVCLSPDAALRRRLSDQTRVEDSSQSSISYEMCFVRPSEEAETQLKSLSLYSSTTGKVAQFEPIELPANELREIIRDSLQLIRARRPLRLADVRVARCTWLTDDKLFWTEIFERSKRRSDTIAAELRQLHSEVLETSGQRTLFKETEDDLRERVSNIDRAASFYESDFSIEEYIARMHQAELTSVIGLDGFIPVPIRKTSKDLLPEFETFQRFGPTRLRMRDLTLNVAGFAVDCGRLLETALETIYPLGPFRRPPERWYIFTGTNPQEVGYRGDLLPNLLFRRPELVNETNGWLDRLEVGYHIKIQSVGAKSRDLFEVRLIDKRRGVEIDVSLSDVGFGVSQLLPFVVQSLASESQTITIEQPEVHIHPRLQADLGDLLISSIQQPRSHRFIIETHSEHLILRLLRRIRETNEGGLPAGHPGLRPEDVSVIYLERGEQGTQTHHLRIDESGEFVDRWPKGFFPERAKELF